MILIDAIVGNVLSVPLEGRETDELVLEWFETSKRVMRRKTRNGREIGWRALKGFPLLTQGDILWMDSQTVVVVCILPAPAIVLQPATMKDIAIICYEIGNKHLPIFLQENEVLVPYEEPLFRWLEAKGYQPRQEQRVLTGMLRSNVMPHEHGTSSSLFSKILQLTAKQ